MKKIIFSLFALLFSSAICHAYTDIPQTNSWEKEYEIQNPTEKVFLEDSIFDGIAVEIISGKQSDFQFQMGSWDFWESIDPKEKEDIFLGNPTDKLFVKNTGSGKIKITFLNSKSGLSASYFPRDLSADTEIMQHANSAGIKIISRSEWGADESLGVYSLGDEPPEPYHMDTTSDFYQTYKDELKTTKEVIYNSAGLEYVWPRTYAPAVKKIIIHHTASTNSLDDPTAALRNIYYYHTASKGWGDIGYNYIIDTKGNIYEGRGGGAYVVGGHASRANTGSVGISVLGNYQDMVPTQATKDALTKLTSFLAKEYAINPVGVESFRGNSVPNIIGHRDVGATACPGENLYAFLPDLRGKTLDLAPNWADATKYDFDIAQTLPYLDIDPTANKIVAIKLKNTGSESWQTGTRLIPIDTRNSVKATISMSEMLEPMIAPGEEATFFTTVQAGIHSGIQHVNLALEVNGKGVTEKQFPIPVRVADAVLNYEFIKASFPSEIAIGDIRQATVKLKNTSNFTWSNTGDAYIRLQGTQPKGRISAFTREPEDERYNTFIRSDQQDTFDFYEFGALQEQFIAPGETGNFVILLQAPDKVDTFSEHFTPNAPNIGWFNDNGMVFNITTRPPTAKASLISAPTETNFINQGGERIEFDIKLKNSGELVWNSDKVRFVSDNSKFPVIQTSYGGKIGEGGSTTMHITMQAPYKTGMHYSTLKLATGIEGHEFENNPQIKISTNVNQFPVLRGKLLTESLQAISLKPYETKTLEIKVENTGSVEWHNTGGAQGQGATMLGTIGNKESNFSDNKWLKNTRGALLVEDTVKVGRVGTFILTLTSDGTRGTFGEFFNPVIDWFGWIDGAPLTLWVQVMGDNSTPNNTPQIITQEPEPTVISEPDPVIETPTEISIESPLTEEPDIRILLSFNSDDFFITSQNSFVAKDLNGKELLKFNGGETAEISNGAIDGLRFSDGVRLEGEVLEIKNWDHTPAWSETVNDNLYRNTLEVRQVDGDWVIINELPLEEYMLGLAEVPESELPEKHKTIMVASRTYALYYIIKDNKFEGKPYDGSDDPNVFQKYLGYNYETRAPKHVDAVRDTVGEVVKYNGEVVKTPYFNSSDGNTRSAEEVWGWTHTPYLKSVPDTTCANPTPSGHMVGLSGCGATGAAEAGKTYQEILKYYYSGIEIDKAY